MLIRFPDLWVGGLLPCAVSLAAGAVLAFRGPKRERDGRLQVASTLAAPVAFLALARSVPFAPQVAHRPLGEVAALAILLPLLLRRMGERPRLRWTVLVGCVVGAAAAILDEGDFAAVAAAFAVCLGALFALYRLTRPNGVEAQFARSLASILALGLAFVAAASVAPLPAGVALAVAAGLLATAATRRFYGISARSFPGDVAAAFVVLAAAALDVVGSALHAAWGLPILAGVAVAGWLSERLYRPRARRKADFRRRVAVLTAAASTAGLAYAVTLALSRLS